MKAPVTGLVRVPAAAVVPRAGRWSRRGLIAIVAVGLAAGLLFGLVPDLDLAVAGLFYDPAQKLWPYAWSPTLQSIRDFNQAVTWVVGGGTVVLLLLRMVRLRPLQRMSLRIPVFILASLAVTPGLIINGILKPHGGRPRPIEMTQFDGPLDFVPWWSPFGRCDGNCSFASGEMASAIWLLAVAVVLPARLRPLAIALVLVYALVIGSVRIAMGGHFVSDVLMSGVLTAFTIWLLYGLIVAPAPDPD